MAFQISFSAVQKFEECAKKYYFHYIRKVRPIKMGSPLIFGSAIDTALNELLITKDVEKARSIFIEEWSNFKFPGDENKTPVRNNPKVKYSKADSNDTGLEVDGLNGDPQNDNWLYLRSKGLLMIDTYNHYIIPSLEVITVQNEVLLSNKSNDQLRGYLDLIAKFNPTQELLDICPEVAEYAGKIILFDNKTSGYAYKSDSVKTSPQLGTYFPYSQKNYNTEFAGYIVLHKNLRKNKKPAVRVQIVIDKIDPDVIDSTFNDYNIALVEIKDGNFPRNLESCMGKYGMCEYYNLCHNMNTVDLVDVKVDVK
jgi:hypothetical protein